MEEELGVTKGQVVAAWLNSTEFLSSIEDDLLFFTEDIDLTGS